MDSEDEATEGENYDVVDVASGNVDSDVEEVWAGVEGGDGEEGCVDPLLGCGE